jgi:hypothetical protein
VFDDPRSSECGHSMCNGCITLLLNKKKNVFLCSVCDKFHELPKDGFLKNQVLAKICEAKPNEVNRGRGAHELKSLLD